MTEGIDPGIEETALLSDRLAAQLLLGPPARTVLDVVGRLLAVQGQDPRGARLAVRSRSTGLHSSDIDHELTRERSLVLTTLNRGTLHLVRSVDYWWLHALTAPRTSTMNSTRLGQLGVTAAEAERAAQLIVTWLANGPMTRVQLRDHLVVAGVRVEGQALPHLLLYASLKGHIVRGPMVGNEQAFVLVQDWLGRPPKEIPIEKMLGELARRFLAGHGPATDRDLARWAGITLRDARTGLAATANHLHQREDGLVDLASRKRVTGAPPPKLLGSFDPLLFGWASREPILGSHGSIVTTNGIFRPFALLRGRAVGTWTMPRQRVLLSPFQTLSVADEAAFALEALAVERFLS